MAEEPQDEVPDEPGTRLHDFDVSGPIELDLSIGSGQVEVRLTDASFNFLDAPNARGYFLGDYQGLAAAGVDFLPVFCLPEGVFVRRLSPSGP